MGSKLVFARIEKLLTTRLVWQWFVALWVVSCVTFSVNVLRTESFVWGDAYFYYAYTRSMVMDRDIHFQNEFTDPDYNFQYDTFEVPETGYWASNFSPGTSFLWIPGFIAGQLLSLLAAGAGLAVSTQGYSWVTGLVTGYTAVGLSVGGLYLLFCCLKKEFSTPVAVSTTVVLFVTTQLLFYTMLDPFNSHSASFFVASWILWLKMQWLEGHKHTWKLAAVTGLAIGLLGLVRNQEILVSVAVAATAMVASEKKLKGVLHVSLMAVLAAAVVSIQVWFTWILFHKLGSPYMITGQVFAWMQPDFGRVLLSQGNGFFRYAPIAVVSVIGLVWLSFRRRLLALTALLVFGLQLYVIAAWVPEVVGGPYGSRMFTGTLPWLALGLGYVVQKLLNAPDRYGPPLHTTAVFSALLLTFWNLYQILIMYLTW